MVIRAWWLCVAVALSGCANWDNLRCEVRMACADGGGPFAPRAEFSASGPLVSLSVGAQSAVVVTTTQVTRIIDGGVVPAAVSTPGRWSSLDVSGTPSQFFLLDSTGSLRAWVEPRSPDAPDFTVQPAFTSAPLTVSAYLSGTGAPNVAYFSSSALSTTALGIGADGTPLGSADQACVLDSASAAAIAGESTGLVGGLSSTCSQLSPGPVARYVLTFWPRDGANPLPIALPTATAPSQLRLGSNGNEAIVVYEVQGGFDATRVNAQMQVAPALPSVHVTSRMGLVLEDTQVLRDPDAFVYVLNNRGPDTITVTPDSSEVGAVTVPQNALVAIFGRWSGTATTVVAMQVLRSIELPFDAVRLGVDTRTDVVWLAASSGGQVRVWTH